MGILIIAVALLMLVGNSSADTTQTHIHVYTQPIHVCTQHTYHSHTHLQSGYTSVYEHIGVLTHSQLPCTYTRTHTCPHSVHTHECTQELTVCFAFICKKKISNMRASASFGLRIVICLHAEQNPEKRLLGWLLVI